MRRTTVLWLAVAISLVLAGCIIFGGVMTASGWNFTKLSTVQYETNEYEIKEGYKDISIITDTADIVLVPSEQGRYSVVCYEEKNAGHTVSVKDGTLEITLVDMKKWHERIGFNFGTPKITVYLPRGEYGALLVKSSTGNMEISKEFTFKSIDISESTGNVTSLASASEAIKINTSAGNILVESISAGSLDLSVSTGRIAVSALTCEGDVKIHVSTGKADLYDIACKNLTSSGDTGDLSLENVIATEKLILERTTGDILFEGCDAAEIFMQTATGHVTGSLLSDKVFITRTDTGKVDVPKTVTGGTCEIITDTGDIKITID